MNLITEAPIWFLLLCLLAGGIYAAALYFRERKSELSKTFRWIGAVLRFLSVSFLAFLLLSPLVRITNRTVEKPVIILVQDNSSSILLNKDSLFYKNEWPKRLQAIYEDLSKDYEVIPYTFSDQIHDGLDVNYSGKQTNLAALFEELAIRYTNRNVGAVILASDGIYNTGSNPLYATDELSFPIYTIALGDTTIPKDIILSQVNYNKVCYLGNSFPIEAIALANKCKGANTTLTVSQGAQVLFTKTLSINEDAFLQSQALVLKAQHAGIQHYRISLSTVEGEISVQNNVRDIFVDVLDARQKILILTGAPHPDVAALRESIEKNENYEVEVIGINDFQGNLAAYNLVIFHQVPYKGGARLSWLENLKDQKIPSLFVIGNSSDLFRFNNMKLGLSIGQIQNRSDEAQAVINNSFALFNVSPELKDLAQDAPPLLCPFGDYKAVASASALFYQRIGKVSTIKPLILFNQGLEEKIGIICGEGIWRWRLHDYLKTGNHLAFDELVGKTIQYLAVKADKSFFRVHSKSRFAENELLKFDAEVYNESYEMINDPEVRMVITDEAGKKYDYTFNRTSAAYQLNAGILAVGDYKYTASVKTGNKVMQENGAFSVVPVVLEALQSVADHNLLNNLATRHGGEMIYPRQSEEIGLKIRNRDDIKSVSYTERKFNDLISLSWVFIVILLLIATEWFMRKRGGAY